jgi:hypothetical protein
MPFEPTESSPLVSLALPYSDTIMGIGRNIDGDGTSRSAFSIQITQERSANIQRLTKELRLLEENADMDFLSIMDFALAQVLYIQEGLLGLPDKAYSLAADMRVEIDGPLRAAAIEDVLSSPTVSTGLQLRFDNHVYRGEDGFDWLITYGNQDMTIGQILADMLAKEPSRYQLTSEDGLYTATILDDKGKPLVKVSQDFTNSEAYKAQLDLNQRDAEIFPRMLLGIAMFVDSTTDINSENLDRDLAVCHQSIQFISSELQGSFNFLSHIQSVYKKFRQMQN